MPIKKLPKFTDNRAVNFELVKQSLKGQLSLAEPIKYDVIPSGMDIIDNVAGGLLKGAITEIVGAESVSGLFLDYIFTTLANRSFHAALVDACYCFNPDQADDDCLSKMLWVASKDVRHAIKAVDVLLRDKNLPLIILDLPYLTSQDAKHLQASVWHRFQRIVEAKNIAMVVLCKRPITAGAKMQVVIRNHINLEAISERRYTLMASFKGEVITRYQYISDQTFQNHKS